MRNVLWSWWLVCGFLCLLPPPPAVRAADRPQAEIVVATRYFQQEGISHAHLYLYREDGKFLRQLTSTNTGQDRDPVFAPDGETIVFARANDAGGTDYWSVEPRGGKLHMIPATPDWYVRESVPSVFAYVEDDPGEALFATEPTKPAPKPPTYRAPDRSVELVLRVDPADEEDGADGERHGKHYLLRDLQTGRFVEMGKLPGFIGLTNVLGVDGQADGRFLLVPPLHAAFFGLHLDSTNGSTVFALDLDGKRLVRLSPNGAVVYPLPGEPAFLTLTENRYLPFGDGTKTANCSFVERWGADLKALRYAKPGAAGVCYGASMYRPGRNPATFTVRGPKPE